MCKPNIMIVFLYFCFLPITVTQAQKDNGSNMNKESPPVTITLTSISVTDKIVELNYKIRNTSEQDIWICDGVNGGYGNFEVAMTKDSKTLLIRRRLSVPMFGFLEQPFGCYIRIRKGQSRKESLLLSLPIHPRRVFLEGRQLSNDIEYAKYLVLEIGFYSGDMPRMIFDMLEEAEKDPQKKHVKDTGYPIDIIGWLDGPLYFNEINEEVRDRDEQVIIPWTDQALKSEKILRATATDLNIPYVEYPLDRGYTFPILSSCTKIEIEYRPSMLDYFFSNSEQQLMNKTEMNYLQSQKTVVSDDLKLIGAMCDEIDHAHRIGQIVNESRSAHISCYNRDEFLTSFFVYGKESILTKDKQCLWHRGSLQSLKMFAAQIRPFELRIECASHIKNLWYRLRLYHIAQKTQLQDLSSESEIIYPVWTEWCDAMVHAYMDVGHYNENFLKAFICPSANEGKSNYAINPSCKPDSPADMVLLFETKASWDRYGGPDLFTFDNHDPKGGCVLLNDGIVKFIRTKEELQQLRWK